MLEVDGAAEVIYEHIGYTHIILHEESNRKIYHKLSYSTGSTLHNEKLTG